LECGVFWGKFVCSFFSLPEEKSAIEKKEQSGKSKSKTTSKSIKDLRNKGELRTKGELTHTKTKTKNPISH
jgi:hypothetical protein